VRLKPGFKYRQKLQFAEVFSAILLGNSARLRRALISEILTDQRVLQVAHVYGWFTIQAWNLSQLPGNPVNIRSRCQ